MITNTELLQLLTQLGILDQNLKLSKKSWHILIKNQKATKLVLSSTPFIIGNLRSTLRERIYAIKHNIRQTQLCVVCNNKVPFRKDGVCVGYPDTCSKRCGYLNPNRTEKRKQTSTEKYGVTHPAQNEQIKEKTASTNLKRYGAMHKNQNHFKTNTLALLSDMGWLYEQHHTLQKTLQTIANELGVNSTTVQRHLAKFGIKIKHFYQSTGEKELSHFLAMLSVPCVLKDRQLISPHEIDIFIPEHKLAIEYCGLYWHSEQRGKDRYYHKNKYEKCKEKGIQLLTIFEDEWINRQEQVKRKIQNLLGKEEIQDLLGKEVISVSTKNTQIVKLTTGQKDDFFETNHIQGSGPGSINYGLMHDDKIVAAATFINQKNGKFILSRYVALSGVVDGLGRLIKHFQSQHDWNEIVSFVDLRWGDEKLYETMGWQSDRTTSPDYFYSPDGHTRIHKCQYEKKYSVTLPENNNILKLWDCGKMHFVLKK